MRRSETALLALLLVGYASFYLCRANVEAAMPLLLAEGYDKASLGRLASTATLAYAIGKIALGATGDVLGGKRLMVLAVAGSVVCSFAIGLQSALPPVILFAAANRFFQSGGWPGLVQVVSQVFERKRSGVVMGILSTSYEFGNVFALTLSAFVARRGWRALFVVNPLLFAFVGGAVVLALPRGPSAQRTQGTPSPASGDEQGFSAIVASLATKGSFWTAVVLSALLTFIRTGFLTWTPTYLFEVSRSAGHTEVTGAIVKSAMFPAAGVVAALAVGPIGDWLGPGRRAPIMSVSLTVVVALVLLLAHGGIRDPLAAAFVIAGIGLFLLGPYSLLAGAMALDVSGAQGAATAAGVIDGAGYFAGAASGFVLGSLAQHAGWPAAFDVIAGAAALAVALSTAWSFIASMGEGDRPSPAA